MTKLQTPKSRASQFSPEDFYSRNMIQEYIGSPITGKSIRVSDAVKIANEKLETIIKQFYDEEDNRFAEYVRERKKYWLAELKSTATVVYQSETTHWTPDQTEYDTHKALQIILDIEEIKPKSCKVHTWNQFKDANGFPSELICLYCGKKLKAKWEVVPDAKSIEPCNHDSHHIIGSVDTGYKCSQCGEKVNSIGREVDAPPGNGNGGPYPGCNGEEWT